MEAIWPDYYRETMQTKFQDSANIFWGCLQLNYVRPLQSARNVIAAICLRVNTRSESVMLHGWKHSHRDACYLGQMIEVGLAIPTRKGKTVTHTVHTHVYMYS